MIPAAFGVIRAAIAALDATLTRETLDALDGEDMNDAWRAAGQLSDAADGLYAKMRSAYAANIGRAGRPDEEAPA